jgi:SET domain-containing protein
MPVTQSSMIEVRRTARKGRGVFAKSFIPCDTVFERAPVLVMPAWEVLGTTDDTVLSHYLFEWGKNTVALALGYGSLYNHSYSPNARYEDEGSQIKAYVAVRDIHPGEEITINYNGSPEATDAVWFDVVETPVAGSRKKVSSAETTPGRSARTQRQRKSSDKSATSVQGKRKAKSVSRKNNSSDIRKPR